MGKKEKKSGAAGVWLLEMVVCRNQSKWNRAAKKNRDRPAVWCWGREKDGARKGGAGHMKVFR